MSDREILLKLIASLTLADHIGDVFNDVGKALELLGYDWDWSDGHELGNHLAKEGITTLYGRTLRAE